MTEALSTIAMVEEPWHRLFAEWLAVQEAIPSKLEKQAFAAVCSGRRPTLMEVRALEVSAGFQEMLAGVGREIVARARRKIQARAEQFVEDYVAMAAEAKGKKDYGQWIKYGAPILDRVWAKSEEHRGATQVVVNFGTGFASRQVEDAEFEIVVHKQPE